MSHPQPALITADHLRRLAIIYDAPPPWMPLVEAHARLSDTHALLHRARNWDWEELAINVIEDRCDPSTPMDDRLGYEDLLSRLDGGQIVLLPVTYGSRIGQTRDAIPRRRPAVRDPDPPDPIDCRTAAAGGGRLADVRRVRVNLRRGRPKTDPEHEGAYSPTMAYGVLWGPPRERRPERSALVRPSATRTACRQP
jgi:hypothetical protein